MSLEILSEYYKQAWGTGDGFRNIKVYQSPEEAAMFNGPWCHDRPKKSTKNNTSPKTKERGQD